MGKLNQRGMIGPIEILLLLVILGIIGFVGWRLYEANQTNDTTTTTTQQDTTGTDNDEAAEEDKDEQSDATAWKSYTIKPEKLTLSYPDDWAIKYSIDDYGLYSAKLTSPNDFVLTISAAQGVGGACDSECKSHNLENKVLGTLDFADETVYVVTTGLKSQYGTEEKVIKLAAINQKTCYHNLCYGTLEGKNSDYILAISGGFAADASAKFPEYTYLDPDEFASSADVKTAIQILKTLEYNN